LSGLREQFSGQLAEEVVEGGEEATPEAAEVAPPPWLEGGEMPTGDEAFAWLESLTVGKEEELLAQAEEAAEVRTSELMGRRKTEEPPAEPEPPSALSGAPAPAEVPDWLEELKPPELAGGAEVATGGMQAETARVEESFGWTSLDQAGQPAVAGGESAPGEEAVAPAWLDGGELPTGDEALAWLESLTAGKEEELLAQAEASGEARVAEIMGRPAPEAEVAPAAEVPEGVDVAAPAAEAGAEATAEAFGWTSFGAGALAGGTPEPGAVPPGEVAPGGGAEESFLETLEAVPAAEPLATVAKSPEPEYASPDEEIHWGEALDVLFADEAAPRAPVAEETKMPETERKKGESGTAGAPRPAAPEGPFAVERAYLKKNPRDHEARLTFARSLWQVGERDDALDAYSRVIRSGKLLDGVISELEEYVEQWPEPSTQRVLGDAYMKAGRLQDALDVYRDALETL
jgi:hypothetical protein